MFSRNKEATEAQTGRYKVEPIHSARSHDALADAVQQAMNAGDEKGWRLINVTQHAAVVLLYWETK